MLARAAALLLVLAASGAVAATPGHEHHAEHPRTNMDATSGPFAVPIDGTAPAPAPGTVSITDLRAAPPGGAVRRFRLVADARHRFDGRSPGPVLRVRQGDTVVVRLVNRLAEGTAIHWHGIRLAGSQDGVPGVTQDLVRPGRRFTYRFTVPDAGTFWYHAHQNASRQVPKGLYGMLIVLPRAGAAPGLDLPVALHTYTRGGGGPSGGPIAVNGRLGVLRRAVAPGTPVRLRVLNSDNGPRLIGLAGVAFRVAALDGNDLAGPGELTDTQVPLAASGRVDLTFTMPGGPVALTVASVPDGPGAVSTPPRARVVLGDRVPALPALATLDLMTYGTPAADPLTGPADATYPMVIAPATGAMAYTINGATHPDVPTILVAPGQLIRIVIVNDDETVHPIHLHGHTFTVVAQDGVPPAGSPLHLDTLQVPPGHSAVIAFRADNPGLWMLHCHNLAHAAAGLDMMVDYVGVTSPFRMGGTIGNDPE